MELAILYLEGRENALDEAISRMSENDLMWLKKGEDGTADLEMVNRFADRGRDLTLQYMDERDFVRAALAELMAIR